MKKDSENSVMADFSPYFSDKAFVFNKIFVETEWVIFLLNRLSDLDIAYEIYKDEAIEKIDKIYEELKEEDYTKIKALKKDSSNAVQKFLFDKFKELGIEKVGDLIHFGCSDEDIDNIANTIMIEGTIQLFIQASSKLLLKMAEIAKKHIETVMVTDNRTQTTLGKELTVYAVRLYNLIMDIDSNISVKFSGSAGNYLEMMAAFPNVDWITMCHDFIEDTIGFNYLSVSSEIETYDYATNVADKIRNFNNILRELNSTMRLYCEIGYLVKPRTKYAKVPLSIFDSCAEVLEKSNQVCLDFSNEFPQNRKITDVGIAIEYSVQGIERMMSNFKKVSVKYEMFCEETRDDWSVLKKCVNAAFSVHGVHNAFQELKESVGEREITGDDFRKFIRESQVLDDEQKIFLSILSPTNYIGYAAGITDIIYRQIISKDIDMEEEDEDEDDTEIDDFFVI